MCVFYNIKESIFWFTDLICVDDSSGINNYSTMREESLSTSNCSTTKQRIKYNKVHN